MQRKKALFIVEITILLCSLLLSIAPSAQVADAEVDQAYQLTHTYYSFFDWGPRWTEALAHDVYDSRWAFYGDYKLVSAVYPVLYVWYTEGKIEEGWYYSVARLNVVGREMPQFNIDNPYFVPTNLLGGVGAVVGGTADLDYYVMYPSLNYCKYLDKVYGPAWTLEDQYDGWIVNWNGTITMDPAGTKKILGLSDAEYANLVADPAGWWTTNEATVENAYDDWLDDQGNNVYNIYAFYEDAFWGPGSSSGYFDVFDLDLAYNAGTQETTIIVRAAPTWGFEALFARWLRHSDILRSYEYWFSDIIFNATLGPSTSDVDMDLCSDDFTYMWGEGDIPTLNNNYPQVTGWGWETLYGDAIAKPPHPSEFEDYYMDKTYFNTAPGQGLDRKYMYDWRYADWVDYDYTPAIDNWLLDGEQYIFDWSNTWTEAQAGNYIWVYTQLLGWTNYPNETMRVDWGQLEPGYIEPHPETLPDGVFNYDEAARTITYTGPYNFTQWQIDNINNERMGFHVRYGEHPEGNWSLLSSGAITPWGCPYLQFRIKSGPGDLTGDAYCNLFDLIKIRDHIGTDRSHWNYNSQVDIIAPIVYGDGFINIFDLLEIRDYIGDGPYPPY